MDYIESPSMGLFIVKLMPLANGFGYWLLNSGLIKPSGKFKVSSGMCSTWFVDERWQWKVSHWRPWEKVAIALG